MSDLVAISDLRKKVESVPDFTEIMGGFIDNNLIMSRLLSTGGCTTEILGPQGTGKTSLMLSYATRIMQEYPDEIIIWKDSYQAQCQFNRLENWSIFAQEGVSLVFRDIHKDEVYDVPVTVFKDFKHLSNLVSPQQLNVVYVNDDTIDFIKLINFFRRYKGWQSIFIDEYRDIAPLNAPGIQNQLIGALGSEISAIRKGLVSLFVNTQSKSQIDWRVRDAWMVNIYLAGAKKDKYSSVYQQAINSLEKGSAWVSWEGKFGRISFPPFEPIDPVLDVDNVNKISLIDSLLSKI